MWVHSKTPAETPARDTPAARTPASELLKPASILLVTNQFLPVIGGTEVTTLRDAKALQAHGHAVRVLTLRHNLRWPRTEEMDGVSVRRTGGFFLQGRLRVRFGATWLAEARVWYELVRTRRSYDIVQLRQLGRLARPAVLASFVTGKPLVVRIACAPPPQGRRGSVVGTSLDGATAGISQPYLRTRGPAPDIGDIETLRRIQFLAPLTLRLLRAPQVTFLALSTRSLEHLVQSGFSLDQIVLLPNGIDPTVYQDAALARTSRPPAASGDILTIVCPARLSYQKGQDVLLQAWRTVQEQVPTARLILAGDGPQRQSLERLAADLHISSTVEFAGLVEDVRPLLSAAHGFVLPSRYEGMPNALLEAMAAGLPCVATRVSGTEEIICDGRSGMLVPPEDPETLAEALIVILTDHDRARTLGSEARARVAGAFDHARVMDEFSQLCSVLAGSGTTRRWRARRRASLPKWTHPAMFAYTAFRVSEASALLAKPPRMG